MVPNPDTCTYCNVVIPGMIWAISLYDAILGHSKSWDKMMDIPLSDEGLALFMRP